MRKTEAKSEARFEELYRKLLTIRRFEEKVDEFFRQGKVYGAVHTSVGQFTAKCARPMFCSGQNSGRS